MIKKGTIKMLLTPTEALKFPHGTWFRDSKSQEPYVRHQRTKHGKGGFEFAGAPGIILTATELEIRRIRLVLIKEGQ